MVELMTLKRTELFFLGSVALTESSFEGLSSPVSSLVSIRGVGLLQLEVFSLQKLTRGNFTVIVRGGVNIGLTGLTFLTLVDLAELGLHEIFLLDLSFHFFLSRHFYIWY